jgi:hypothetical protein
MREERRRSVSSQRRTTGNVSLPSQLDISGCIPSKWMEVLEARAVRPRQARYQAALRPIMPSILGYFCTFPVALPMPWRDFPVSLLGYFYSGRE